MANQPKLKPGMPAPASGQYTKIGPTGKVGPEVTAVKGKPLPPTPQPNTKYVLVDPTKHKK